MIGKMFESEEKESKECLELLIVEDGLMNRAAASIYFKKIEGVKPDFAETYEEARKKLEEKVYAGAIIDLHIPEKKGGRPEKLGFDLGRIAEKYAVNHIIFTGGIGHHGQPTVFIYLNGDKTRKKETQYPGKAEPEAWEEAYKALQKFWYNVEEVLKSKLRYKKFRERIRQ